MSLTLTNLNRIKYGNGHAVTADVAFDDSYPTGGESLTPAMLGMYHIREMYVENSAGYTFNYDGVNQKLMAYAVGGAHTHAVALDSGASAAGASHTHAATTPSVMGQTIIINPQASANTDSENADAGSESANGHALAALSTVAASAWTAGAFTQMGWARNICISIQNDSGGPLNLYEGAMAFAVVGTFRGAAQTETITFTSTAGNKAVATAKWRVKYGTKPFDTVTGITVDHVPADGFKISAGPGSRFALMHTLKTPAEADVIKYLKNDVVTSVSGKVDATNSTVLLDTVAATDDFSFYYCISPAITAIAAEATHTHAAGTLADAASASGTSSAAEVGNATNLAAVSTQIIAYGI